MAEGSSNLVGKNWVADWLDQDVHSRSSLFTRTWQSAYFKTKQKVDYRLLDELLEGCKILKDDKTTTVGAVELSGKRYILKRVVLIQ